MTQSIRLVFLITALSCFILSPLPMNAADAEPPLYGMLVSGKRPGPPLWKVSNQGNVLWIFGTLDHLPKKLRWDSSSVSFNLTEADEYISPPRINSSEYNPIKAISLMRTLRRVQRIPEGKSLSDILPSQLYGRFLEVKSIYAPRDDSILTLRPAEAADKLFQSASDSIGISFDQKVSNSLLRLARRKRVEIVSHDDDSLDPKILLQGYENILFAEEIACLESTLDTIETDLEAMVERANAWANGDAELLLKLDYPDRSEVCSESIFDSEELREIVSRTRNDWEISIENALVNNAVTVANFPMREIVHPDGLFARLRSRGYEVSGQ